MKVSRIMIAGAAALTASGVLGMAPLAAQASPTVAATWTKQAPATKPPGLFLASMAYDAATGTAVLFGGETTREVFYGGTWTWNGTTWTHQHPVTRPPAENAAMAYDAATRTVVLFGDGSTWTWDGTTWTEQHPAASPPAQGGAMAYDAATGTVVLFGNDTWTWDGTTWTEQHPAASPPAQGGAMAYDAATGTVVLLNGPNRRTGAPGGTWTWDGTTWTEQHPAASPPGRFGASMAYDAATGTVVLFGGLNRKGSLAFNGTWTWDGTTWTKQAPATSPPARWGAAMTYDAATGNVVMFGGVDPRLGGPVYRGTWTWG